MITKNCNIAKFYHQRNYLLLLSYYFYCTIFALSTSATTTTSSYQQGGFVYHHHQHHRMRPFLHSFRRSHISRSSRRRSLFFSLTNNSQRQPKPLYLSSSSSAKNYFASVPIMSETIKTDQIPKEDDPYTDYEKCVRRLYLTNMFHPVKMGLENMQRLHELIGNPMDDPDVTVIHIAGTNGKGSVALKIANTLQKYSGLRVGLFCSPHVSSFRERMQVNGQLITEDDVVMLLPKLYEIADSNNIPATFFEITTALAFMFYAKEKCNVVVLETGLGGRLDATNVVSAPAISIITSIGLEHTRILGDTIELIAKEKGGIIKPGRPVLVGPHVPHEVLKQCTIEKGAGPYYISDDVLSSISTQDYDKNDYDVENARIAQAALTLLRKSHPHIVPETITQEELVEGTLVRPPCRFEHVQYKNNDNDGTTIPVILDVAHNPPAMQYLVHKLTTTYPNTSFRFVVGMSSDKDLKNCGDALLSLTDPSSIHLVEAAHPRAAKLEAILEANSKLKELGQYNLQDRSITTQIKAALQLMKDGNGGGGGSNNNNGDDMLVVCGSVFLMAEAREALGFDEPRDSKYIAEVAGAGVRHGQENFSETNNSSNNNK